MNIDQKNNTMRIKKIISMALLSLSLSVWNGGAQEYANALDGLVGELSATTVGGTVLVSKKGEAVYRNSFGAADLELGVGMRPEHVLRIGSLTKQFTAAAILKLEEEGRLSIGDDITEYIKDYPDGHGITVAHLLSHTSGIANYTDMPELKGDIRRKDLSPGELMALFKDAPLDFAPGTGFKYSNSGYILLGMIIEAVSGTTYADYLDKTFFGPLGMDKTRYDDTSGIIIDRVPGYDREKGGYRNTDYLSMAIPYAGGALLSTVDDLSVWNKAVMGHGILSRGAVGKAHSRYVLDNGERIDYGLGWRLGNVQGSPSIKHGGSVNGFTSFALYLPEEEVFVALLTNCGCTWPIEDIASKMAAVAMGRPYELGSVEVPAKSLERLQGEYLSDQGVLRTIRLEDGTLLYFGKGGEKTRLLPLGGNRFRLDGTLSILDFGDGQGNGPQGFVTHGLYSPVHWERTATRIKAYRTVPLSKRDLERYGGDYKFPNGRVFKVVSEQDRMYGQMGSNREEIRHLGGGRFHAVGIDALLLFTAGPNDKINGLTIVQKNEKKAVKVR